MNTQLCVIGGGPGGYAAAFRAADLGMQVTLVDQEPRLGGTCLLRGCIPSKALLHVAKTVADAGHLVEWGVAFSKPTIDVGVLRARKEKLVATLTGGLKMLAAKRNVTVVQAKASFDDSRTIRLVPIAGSQLPDDRIVFENCILATGSSPTRIPLFDLSTHRVMDSTGALSLPDVPKSLLVIGGGYIGLELGTIYASLGSRVTVVEMTDGLLPNADRDLVRPLQKRLAGVFQNIHLNTRVVALVDKGDGVEATFDGNLPEKTAQFSRVLVCVGRKPNTAGLGLEETNVRIDERGFIVVDQQRRTNDSHIWAIGDVVGDPMLAHKASHEGKVAVEAIAGSSATFSPLAIPAVVFTDPEIAWAGITETEARSRNLPVDVSQFPWAANGRAHAVGHTDGMTKWLIDPRNQQVIGCGIVGSGAGDLIAEAVIAIEQKATIRQVAEVIHQHPTLGETLGGAAEMYFGSATDFYRPKRST
jgi:dihydrolipoamide dehydrogenase